MTTAQADREQARELALYTINTGEIFHSRTRPLIKNYALKKVKGTYDKEMALKGVINLIVPEGIKGYIREFGSIGGPVNAATKRKAAEEILDWMQEGIRDQAAEIKKAQAAKKKARK